MLLILLFILIATLGFPRKDESIALRILFVTFLAGISIVLSYRASDFPIYQRYFDYIEPLQRVIMGEGEYFTRNPDNFEPGYVLWNSFFKMLSSDVEFMYVITNLLILLTVLKVFNGKSENFYKLFLPYFSFIFITIQVGIIRQAMAIAIFYLCLDFLVRKRFFAYFFGTIIACLFHGSAIILPLLYFVVRRHYTANVLVPIYLAGILIFIGILPVNLMNMMEGLSNVLLPGMGSRLTYYLWQLEQLDAPSKINLGIFENSILFFYLFYIRKNLIRKRQWDDFMNICFNLSIIYIALYIYLFEFSNTVYRLNYFFVVFKFFVLVRFIENLNMKTSRLLGYGILILYCIMMLIIRILQGF